MRAKAAIFGVTAFSQEYEVQIRCLPNICGELWTSDRSVQSAPRCTSNWYRFCGSWNVYYQGSFLIQINKHVHKYEGTNTELQSIFQALGMDFWKEKHWDGSYIASWWIYPCLHGTRSTSFKYFCLDTTCPFPFFSLFLRFIVV